MMLPEVVLFLSSLKERCAADQVLTSEPPMLSCSIGYASMDGKWVALKSTYRPANGLVTDSRFVEVWTESGKRIYIESPVEWRKH